MKTDILTQSRAKSATYLLQESIQFINALALTADFTESNQGSMVNGVVILPSQEKLEVSAPTAEAAAAEMMRVLCNRVLEVSIEEPCPPEWQELLKNKNVLSYTAETKMYSGFQRSTDTPTRTKERQDTIGVSSKVSLQKSVAELAKTLGDSAANVARRLVRDGFEEFEERSFSESPRKLLDSYENQLNSLEGEETTQWMVRLDRHLFIRLKLTAKEYGKSASQIAAICMSHALFKEEKTAAQAASQAELAIAKAKIEKIKGPAARQLAVDIGIGSHVGLMNGVLSGRTQAPRKILDALSTHLDVPAAALSQVFEDSFQSSEVPAFKAEDGKPSVCLEPTSWENAVKLLGLSDTETARLMQFKD